MARFFDLHPDNPQPRTVGQIVAMLHEGAVIAYPTDSGYALGCSIDSHDGADRIRRIRHLSDKHDFTLVCSDFGQLGQLVHLDNAAFRAIKASTPGPYTFILPATSVVPRRLAHPKKKTVGVRIPDNRIVQAILADLGQPLLSSTLLLPGAADPDLLTDGWSIKEELDHLVDAVVEGGIVPPQPTTVIDYSAGDPVIRRQGAGDITRWE
ncbi:MAG: threonylcarbamoyl-AMP synthase [Cellulomonadaceae bacterium]|nr:threonylcarbamoyl-AMP synthase [Cellulomonadaceae bacterium]